MDYQVSDLKESIRGILTGISINNIKDLNGRLARVATTVLMKGDVPEMTDQAVLTTYDGVFDYNVPSTIFGSLILDVRPQGVSRDSRRDVPYKKPLQDFDLMKQRLPNGVMITFEQRKTKQIMRLANTRDEARIILDTATDDTAWTASGNASGLAVDRTNFYDDPASLRFNLAAGGTQGLLTQTFSSQTDLSAYDGVGVAFLAVQMPDATSITSIGMHLGNDSANYWSVSATQGFLGAWIANDWLLVALDLSTMTMTGTVDNTKIDYVQLQFNYASATKVSNVRIGGLWLSLPSPTEIIHETTAIFVPQSSTTPLKTITNDNDSLILGQAAFNLYAHECARDIALGKGGTIANGVIAAIDLVLEGDGGRKLGLYQKFRGDNPAQTLRTIGSYYEFRNF